MDSNATTVLLMGFGPEGSVSLIITLGFGTTTVEPGDGFADLLLLGAT